MRAHSQQCNSVRVVALVRKHSGRKKSHERHILDTLGGKQHVVPLLHASPCGDLWLPYVPDRGVRSYKDLARLAADLGEALAYVHSAGWVHRDVKRRNVRFSDSEGAVLIDFDLAVAWRTGEAPLTGWAGTQGWLAPEVIQRQPYTSSVDVWGLSLVLLDELFQLRGQQRGMSTAHTYIHTHSHTTRSE